MLTAVPAGAQRQQSATVDPARERARQPYQAGMEHFQREAFDAAARSFQDAIDLDPSFDMAHYMLGRTHMMTKRYASAILALTRCRDLHLTEASLQSLNRQEVQRQRRQRLDEITERIANLEAILQTPQGRNSEQLRNEIRMLEERRRQIGDAERELSADRAVPAFVSLALGSAYFRSGKLADAEAAYKAAVAADDKVGEAHSNLAVVYMETGRYDEAERSLRNAERAGFRVAPALKDELKRRKSSR